MASEAESNNILRKLDEIKSELDYIKENMVDKDQILTKDDKKAIAEAKEDYKKGRTTSLEDLKSNV